MGKLAFQPFGRLANLSEEPPVLRETRHTDAPTDLVERPDISDGNISPDLFAD